jgi:quercetin dioxygenase-like cupin family protein
MTTSGNPGPADSAGADPAPRAVDLRDYVLFDLDGAAGRRVLQTDVLAVDLVCLEPGQQIPPRTFATADIVYTVLGGLAWVVTDEAQVTLSALQAVVMPAGTPHGLRNDGIDPLIVQVLVSPPDELAAPSGEPLRPVVPIAEEPRTRRSLRDLLGGRD